MIKKNQNDDLFCHKLNRIKSVSNDWTEDIEQWLNRTHWTYLNNRFVCIKCKQLLNPNVAFYLFHKSHLHLPSAMLSSAFQDCFTILVRLPFVVSAANRSLKRLANTPLAIPTHQSQESFIWEKHTQRKHTESAIFLVAVSSNITDVRYVCCCCCNLWKGALVPIILLLRLNRKLRKNIAYIRERNLIKRVFC